jgi:hypothetical protein
LGVAYQRVQVPGIPPESPVKMTRVFTSVKRDPVRVKRDLLQCQKRPNTVSKETYCSVKRDLIQCQKRSNTVSKET